MPQNVAIYIRVSTQEQANEGYSIQAQTERLKAYCVARNWPIYETYVDPGFSGSNTQRPALKKLFADITAGLVDCVLVYKLDRLSRSQKDTLYMIEDVFLKNHVDFVSMSENFDTSSPLGRAMIGILSVFAQLEREQIKERMALGRAERAKEGYWHGGGRAPFGYDYVNGDLKKNDLEALAVRYIYERFLAGDPLYAIFSKVREKYAAKMSSVTNIHTILSRPLYRGIIRFQGKTYPGRHPALIDQETFERAAALLNDRRRIAASKRHPFNPTTLLGGLLYCENCGAGYLAKGNYSGHKKTGLAYRPYYYCYSRAKTSPNRVIDPDCKNPVYAVVDLDAFVIKEIRRLLDPAYFNKLVSSASSHHGVAANREYEKGVIMRRIDALDLQLTRVLDLYQLGSVSIEDIGRRAEELQSEKNALQTTLSAIECEEMEKSAAASSLLSVDQARELLGKFNELIASPDQSVRRGVVHKLISKIIVTRKKGTLDILWNF